MNLPSRLPTVLALPFAACLAGHAATAPQPSSGVKPSVTPMNGVVGQVKVQPDLAPDCSSLKSIVESVTRGCTTNDAKAVAIYNFMQLAFYHQPYAKEDGGIPALKVITCYGWGLCGGTHAVESALWRELGWGWRFVGWPGHTTVEAQYDGKWHYLDNFLKYYAWMPNGKGGQTIAGEEDLKAHKGELIDSVLALDGNRGAYYQKSDACAMVNGKANWTARDFLSCGDDMNAGVPELSIEGSEQGWMGYNHATGSYSTDVVLAPGMSLTSGWDAVPDAWYWKDSNKAPRHSCPGWKDTRNDPGFGLVIEPYIDSGPARSYGNGVLAYEPDLSNDAFLAGLEASENVKLKGKALGVASSSKPGSITVRLASPYLMTKATGDAAGADSVQISVDDGKTFAPIDLKDFGAAVKGRLSALVKIGFKDSLQSLKLAVTVQNNPYVLPYLSPGKNSIKVSVGDAKALGKNKLVVTYAYRLGSRGTSYEQLVEQGKRIAMQVDATWAKEVTVVRKTFTAKDLPATFEIDCPTPKGRFPVYPRMISLCREVIGPTSTPSPLPAGAVEAKAGPDDTLPTVPSPFQIGTKPPG